MPPVPKPIPTIPTQVVEWLEDTFPPINPEPGMPLDEVFHRAGRQDIIRRLRYQHDRQQQAGHASVLKVPGT